MQRGIWKLTLLLPLLLLLAAGCTKDKTTETPVAAFVGSATCGTTNCHETIHDTWAESGHPYKLTKIDGVAPTAFPAHAQFPQDPQGPPEGYTWEDVTYMIGGYGWKMRWVDDQGYVVTSGAAGNLVQYNFEDNPGEEWVTYTQDEPGTKPYNCGKCHTTGWIADEDWETDGTLDDNQDGLPGMHGTFEATGIHCEQCHGPGSLHADAPSSNEMELTLSSDLCGQCHMRNADHSIAASGGFIKHHEQYDEWLHSPHNPSRQAGAPGCNDCHDPHASTQFDDVAMGMGVKTDCQSCHGDITTTDHVGDATCVDCHMPQASKTAVKWHEYKGDIKTHIWAINTDPVGKTDGMFNAEGNLVLEDGSGKAAVTLDFACYGCHAEPGTGEGGDASEKTLQQLSDRAVGIHGALEPPALDYAGSEACGDCHTDHYTRWSDSGHPYKLTKLEGVPPTDHFPAHAQFPNDVDGPPAGYTWEDVTYTIGGYGWKMRWVDANGYVVTSGAAGDLVQHNFEADEAGQADWVTYHTQDEPGTKPYNCGACHTTGWVADEDWDTDGTLDDNQDGLEGMHGTFFAGGVHCEECHGMGNQHVYSPGNYGMTVDSSSELCGQCHTRDAENRIAAKGGFIKHHEQYDEWLHSPHGATRGPGCNDCHDSHSSTKFDDVAAGTGMTADCTSCHSDITHMEHNGMPDCIDCHMPKASKTAVKVHEYQGDIKTHIWSINTDPVGKTDGMFDAEGAFVLLDGDQAKVTLDFACYGCHSDPDTGEGGTIGPLSLEELSAMADGMHTPPTQRVISMR